MRAVFTVEVPDGFLERRAREHAQEDPDSRPDDPLELLRGRAADVAADELPLAFYGWPVEVTVEVEP